MESKVDQWDGELAKAGIQMAGAAAKGSGSVLVAVIDGLIEKGVFSTEEVRDMLDRREATVRRAEGEIVGDLTEEEEVPATMAIVDHLRDIPFSGRNVRWAVLMIGARRCGRRPRQSGAMTERNRATSRGACIDCGNAAY